MAPSPLDISILNSTSGLLAVLDLNEHQKPTENMEEMDINQLQDVPDTPDRLAARKDIVMDDIDNQARSSAASDVGNLDLLGEGFSDRPRGRSRLIAENGNSRKLYSHFRKDPSICDGNEQGNSSSVSKNARLFRKIMVEKTTANHEIRHSTQHKHTDHVPSIFRGSGSNDHLGERAKLDSDSSEVAEVLAPDAKVQDGTRGKLNDLISGDKFPYNSAYSINGRNMKRKMIPGNANFDKGKTIFTESPSRSYACEDINQLLDLSTQNKCTGIPESARPSKDLLSEETKNGSMAANHCSLYNPLNFSKASGNASKGKTKTEDTESGAGAGSDCGKEIDLSSGIQPKTGMSRSLHSITLPRNTGQRRLVRNGCISPYNIAKAKQSAESHQNSSNDDQQDIMRVVPDDSSCLIDIVRPTSESNFSDRLKGKGVLNYSYPSKEHDAKEVYSLGRSSLNFTKGVKGMADGCTDAFRCFDEIGGWRSTHNHSKKTSSFMSGEEGYLSGNNNGARYFLGQHHAKRTENSDNVGGGSNNPEIALIEVQDSVSCLNGHSSHMVQARSCVSESDRENGRRHGSNKLMKRYIKHGLAQGNPGECSTSTIDDSEIACLGSSKETPNGVSTRSKSPHHRASLKPVIEIDDMSPDIRCNISQNVSHMLDDDSHAKAIQLEADEILARQLQEQFYHELPGVGGGEIDANLAWTLQQEEDARLASSRGMSRVSHSRDSTMSHLYRQYPQRSVQNPPVQSGNRARGANTRMARLRGGFRSRSPRMSSRGMNFQFPPNMDLDTRIHFLEALEAAVGNGSELNAGHFFQIQRDFNENDYEMLLALDENNHQHVGASLDRINGLPESTVQAENLEEACAICLETPTIGDTIRHLPCLHKFHKDCIDPWLRRRTSCPVCKSSITI